ncbi:DUF523 and DUF1722 domain-containing protein [candidate division WOR-3 bacterium]|nr:DUF523 and DUF1722 domain-containing protein [candidate division WOR-3 bacterium]
MSKCIEYEKCRWNGAVISSPLVKKFMKFVDFMTICPEVEIGLGTPRKPVRLIKTPKSGISMIQHETGLILTEKMNAFSNSFLSNLDEIDGFILKDRSPSCGIKDVKIYSGEKLSNPVIEKGSGLFATAVLERFGYLPVESEGRLNDDGIRELFLTKLYSITKLRILSRNPLMKELVDFHAKNKYLFMCYNQSGLKILGRIVSNPEKLAPEKVFEKYVAVLPQIFFRQFRKGSAVNTLLHGFGYVSQFISKREREYYLSMLEGYKENLVSIAECRSVLMSWIIRFEEKYLIDQTFFQPFPPDMF